MMTFSFMRVVVGLALAAFIAALGASISVAADRIRAPEFPSVEEPTTGDPASEVSMFSGLPGCRPKCKGLAGWESTVAGNDLRYALAIAYTASLDFRGIARAAMSRGTDVTWGELPSATGGQFSASTREVIINQDLRAEPIPVLAAVLAHEVAHAADDRSGRDGADCFDAEIYAFKWGTVLFNALAVSLSLWETTWVQSFRLDTVSLAEGRMQERVVLSPHYQIQCLGRTLDS